MRLRVSHTTTYRFDPPMRGLVQSLRLTPSAFEGQTVIEHEREVTGGTFGAAFRDGAGDWIETVSVRARVSQIEVTNICSVETSDLAGVLRGHSERVVPAVYLQDTQATSPNAAIRTLARDTLDGIAETDTLERAHALSDKVNATLDYVSGETQSQTSAIEALERGQGVCQDQTHLLIALARCSGIPARYVCGYLFAGDADDLVGAEASHAWAELHVPSLGWVGFDATNAVCPDARYIRLGSGYDAQDAAPIRGIAMGGSDETLDVSVSVQQIQEQ